MKEYKKREKGITLIALVITIIVLLILAGIAIAALSGENGILTRASEAKEKTGREEIIEKARINILEKQTENLGTLTEQELTNILTPAYGTLSNNEEAIVLDKILTTTDNKYEIPVKEIWNGKLTTSSEEEMITFQITTPQVSGSIEAISKSFNVPKGTTWLEFFNAHNAEFNNNFAYWSSDNIVLFSCAKPEINYGEYEPFGFLYNEKDWPVKEKGFEIRVEDIIENREIYSF